MAERRGIRPRTPTGIQRLGGLGGRAPRTPSAPQLPANVPLPAAGCSEILHPLPAAGCSEILQLFSKSTHILGIVWSKFRVFKWLNKVLMRTQD